MNRPSGCWTDKLRQINWGHRVRFALHLGHVPDHPPLDHSGSGIIIAALLQ